MYYSSINIDYASKYFDLAVEKYEEGIKAISMNNKSLIYCADTLRRAHKLQGNRSGRRGKYPNAMKIAEEYFMSKSHFYFFLKRF